LTRLASLALALALLLGSAVGSVGAGTSVRVLSHGSRETPVVALTFDDGWSAKRCSRILDILERRHVAATFFPYAMAVAYAPAFWRRVARAGYPIGNHTTTHPDLTGLTVQQATAQIARARMIVERVTGRKMIRVLRPPYGAWDKTVVEAARAAGFPTVLLWDTTDRDTSRSASADQMVRAALRGRNGSVVLMHCGPAVTPTILERVIDGYQERGFGFVTVPELLSGRVPATAFPLPPPRPSPLPGEHSASETSLMTIVSAHRYETRPI